MIEPRDITPQEREVAVISLRRRAPAFAAKVAPVYALLKWGWQDAPHPPSEERILWLVNTLIDQLAEGSYSSSSGGLEAWVSADGLCMSIRNVEWGYVGSGLSPTGNLTQNKEKTT